MSAPAARSSHSLRAFQPELLESLKSHLHPVDRVPSGDGWNREELADLISPDYPLVDAAVLVGIVIDGAEPPQIILTRRTETLTHHGGQISFPGGRIDAADVGPVDAALREAWEEIRLPSNHVEALGFLDPYITITGFRVLPLVARIRPGFTLRADPSEVAESFSVPLSLALSHDELCQHSVEFRGRSRKFWQLCYGRHRIWGATAAMLVDLRHRIEAAQQ